MANQSIYISLNTLQDLDIECDQEVSTEIEKFLNLHFRETLPTKAILDVVKLLASLHANQDPNSNAVLDFLYNETKSLSYNDFIWLADHKDKIISCSQQDPDSLAFIKAETYKSDFVRAFLRLIESMFYTQKTNKELLTASIKQEHICTPQTSYANQKMQYINDFGAFQTYGRKEKTRRCLRCH